MRFDLIGLQFEVRTEGGETQQGAEKPREISFSLLHRMKYSQIVLTKRLMHRACMQGLVIFRQQNVISPILFIVFSKISNKLQEF